MTHTDSLITNCAISPVNGNQNWKWNLNKYLSQIVVSINSCYIVSHPSMYDLHKLSFHITICAMCHGNSSGTGPCVSDCICQANAHGCHHHQHHRYNDVDHNDRYNHHDHLIIQLCKNILGPLQATSRTVQLHLQCKLISIVCDSFNQTNRETPHAM